MKKLILFVFLAFAGIPIANAGPIEDRANAVLNNFSKQVYNTLTEEQKQEALNAFIECETVIAADRTNAEAIAEARKKQDAKLNQIMTAEQKQKRGQYFREQAEKNKAAAQQ